MKFLSILLLSAMSLLGAAPKESNGDAIMMALTMMADKLPLDEELLILSTDRKNSVCIRFLSYKVKVDPQKMDEIARVDIQMPQTWPLGQVSMSQRVAKHGKPEVGRFSSHLINGLAYYHYRCGKKLSPYTIRLSKVADADDKLNIEISDYPALPGGHRVYIVEANKITLVPGL